MNDSANQRRPEIELYDVVTDPLQLNDIAGEAKFDGVKGELREQLERWMIYCRDEGQTTEMRALEHMTGRRSTNKKAGR